MKGRVKKEEKAALERLFKEALLMALQTFTFSSLRGGDSVPLMAREMATLLRRDMIPFKEIVRGLYDLLMTPDTSEEDLRLAEQVLMRCDGHEFDAFARLAELRYNPNRSTRRWAILRLADIALGRERIPSGTGTVEWKSNAFAELRKLANTTALRENDLLFLHNEFEGQL